MSGVHPYRITDILVYVAGLTDRDVAELVEPCRNTRGPP